MEAVRKKLSAAFVRTVKTAGRYGDDHGLYLVVGASGSKSWIQRIVIRGKRCDLGLGSAALVSLAEARDAALENRRIARAGGDPLAERRKERTMPTFREAALRAHGEISYKNLKDSKAFVSNLEAYAFRRFGSKPVSEVTGADVRAAVVAIRDDKPEVARKLVLRCSAVFKWAVGNGYRSDNPANARELSLFRQQRQKAHRIALHYSEVKGCVEAVKASQAWASTKLALEFLILTAARSGEVRGALWDEIDLSDRRWTVPSARMKMKRPHVVPLSNRAISILEDAKAISDGSSLVFPSVRSKQLSDMTLSKLVKGLGFDADVHGFRTSFRTWAQEMTDYSFDVCEAALAHAVGDNASQAYARSNLFEKRRELMNDGAHSLIHETPHKC